MQKFTALAMLSLLPFTTNPLQAETLAIEIGNKDLNLAYLRAINTGDAGLWYLDTSLLYTKQHQHQDLLGGIGLQIRHRHTQQPIGFTASIKGFITDVLDYRVGALAVGGIIHYRPMTQSVTTLQASLFYAPAATTTMDGDYFQLVDIALDYQLRHEASLRLGYRDINTGINNAADAELDQGAYLGWLVNF